MDTIELISSDKIHIIVAVKTTNIIYTGQYTIELLKPFTRPTQRDTLNGGYTQHTMSLFEATDMLTVRAIHLMEGRCLITTSRL